MLDGLWRVGKDEASNVMQPNMRLHYLRTGCEYKIPERP